jgi:hypothetical protein
MDIQYLLATARYIEMNPVAAGLVSSPEDYRWSSARAHLEGQEDKLVRVAPLLGIISDWKSYLRPSLSDEVDLIHRHERTGRPLGGLGLDHKLGHKRKAVIIKYTVPGTPELPRSRNSPVPGTRPRNSKSGKKLRATGQVQVRVVDGSYMAYGAKLSVKRGRLKFNDGPVNNPALDILALRDVGTVRAGVKVTGTAEFPEVNLFSQPALPKKDILGYIFLGRPIRFEQREADLLALGAGTLLP